MLNMHSVVPAFESSVTHFTVTVVLKDDNFFRKTITVQTLSSRNAIRVVYSHPNVYIYEARECVSDINWTS